MTVWTTELQRRLEKLAEEGLSARLVGRALGFSRSAVLGRAHRTGIKFYGQEVWERTRPRAAPKPPKPPRARRPDDRVRDYSVVRQARKGGRILDDEFRAKCVAVHLAGLSYKKTAALMNVSTRCIATLWPKRPKIMERAREIAAAIRADAETRAAARYAEQQARKAEKEATHAARIQKRDAHNAPILAAMKRRDAAICIRVLDGETLQSVGDSLGVTRERIRQIVTVARLKRGLDAYGIRANSGSALPTWARYEAKPRQPNGKRAYTKREGVQYGRQQVAA